MKKITSIVLSVILILNLFCALGITVSAETSGTTGDCTWSFDESTETLTISGNGKMSNYNLSDYDGKVTYPWKFYDKIKNVIIENGVTNIGDYAFYGFYKLENVTISDSVTSLGSRAFNSCRSLTNVTIPDSVKSIGSEAFAHCISLANLVIPDNVTSIGDYAFQDCISLTNIIIPDSAISIGENVFNDTVFYNNENNWEGNVLYIGKHLIEAKSLSGTYTIKSDTITIAGSAFDGCNLSSINIPDSVKILGDHVFSGCLYLSSINIPDSVTSIGNYAFSGCSGLSSINIPDSVTSIGNYAFSGCSGLSCIDIPHSVTRIGNYAFWYCKSLTSIKIPDSVNSIGDQAFYGCKNIASISIPDSVTSIGEKVFEQTAYYNNSNNWEETVLYIGKHLIKAKSLFGSYTIKSETITIGGAAFSGCTNLTSITIPDNVISIGKNAFYNCTNLMNVKISNSVESIGDYSFASCKSLTSISVPVNVTSIGRYAFGFNYGNDGNYYKATGLIIYGYKSTSAETYAKENGFDFVEIYEPQTEPTEFTEPSSSESQPTEPSSSESQSIETQPLKTDISKWNVNGIKNKTYTGKVIKQDNIIVSKDEEYADFTTKYKNNLNVGTATVTITGTGDYTGTIVKNFKITKAANPISVKITAKTIKLAAVKKKAQTVKAITVRNAQGKVSYKLTSIPKAMKKFVKINSKGVITISKWAKAKKGTYKIKVKISAAGNKNYNSKTINKTVMIKVK